MLHAACIVTMFMQQEKSIFIASKQVIRGNLLFTPIYYHTWSVQSYCTPELFLFLWLSKQFLAVCNAFFVWSFMMHMTCVLLLHGKFVANVICAVWAKAIWKYNHPPYVTDKIAAVAKEAVSFFPAATILWVLLFCAMWVGLYAPDYAQDAMHHPVL